MKNREILFNYLGQFVNYSITQVYGNNFQNFYDNNPNLLTFINNHQKYVQNLDYINALKEVMTDQDYNQIIKQISGSYVVNTDNHSVEYVPIVDIPTQLLDEENKAIYEEAVRMAMQQPNSHDIKVGKINLTSDRVYLTRSIKTNNGIINWEKDEQNKIVYDDDKGKSMVLKPAKVNSESGFSNALIMSFIIGSIIGIVFLFIYSSYIR